MDTRLVRPARPLLRRLPGARRLRLRRRAAARPAAPARHRRRAALTALGPFFLGNEVWLVAAVGILFGAFPTLEGELLAGYYPAVGRGAGRRDPGHRRGAAAQPPGRARVARRLGPGRGGRQRARRARLGCAARRAAAGRTARRRRARRRADPPGHPVRRRHRARPGRPGRGARCDLPHPATARRRPRRGRPGGPPAGRRWRSPRSPRPPSLGLLSDRVRDDRAQPLPGRTPARCCWWRRCWRPARRWPGGGRAVALAATARRLGAPVLAGRRGDSGRTCWCPRSTRRPPAVADAAASADRPCGCWAGWRCRCCRPY